MVIGDPASLLKPADLTAITSADAWRPQPVVAMMIPFEAIARGD
jgi:hypothetical protein